MARITFVAPPIDITGGMKVVCIYAHELGKLGHDVKVVTPGRRQIPLRKKMLGFARGRGWPTPRLDHCKGRNINLFELDSPRQVCESDVPDADIVVATWWQTAEWVNTFPASKGRKFHLIQHHEVFPHLPARSRDVYRMPFQKIVVATWLKDLMAKEYGAASTVVPNTIDRFEYYSQERDKQPKPTVGLLYSSVEFKGVATAIQTLNLVADKIPDLRILSFGTERLKPHLQLPSRSKYIRLPAQDKLRDIYRSCDVWLTASISEGFNLTALEAMACRTPVVSTKTGWPAEGIVNGVNGYLADGPDELADAVVKILLLENDGWRWMSEAAYRTMTTRSWAASAKMFERALLGRP